MHNNNPQQDKQHRKGERKQEPTKSKNMEKTKPSRKLQKERDLLAFNISLALSKFTAIMAGKPDEYKTTTGGINYYPSDCLNNWRYSTINENGQIVNDPTKRPKEIAGIICEGRRHWNDEPKQITVIFKDL